MGYKRYKRAIARVPVQIQRWLRSPDKERKLWLEAAFHTSERVSHTWRSVMGGWRLVQLLDQS